MISNKERKRAISKLMAVERWCEKALERALFLKKIAQHEQMDSTIAMIQKLNEETLALMQRYKGVKNE